MTNIVVLQGRLSRPAEERVLPSGDRLATLDLTVPAPEPGGRAESAPLAWWDPPGWVLDLDVGVELVVLGRVRRRYFRTGTVTQSRTEVVVEAATPARRATRAGDLVRSAMAALTAAAAGTATGATGGATAEAAGTLATRGSRRRGRAAPTFS